MEYSKDIIFGQDFEIENKKEGILKKHKFITAISIICLILIVTDCMFVHMFIEILQSI